MKPRQPSRSHARETVAIPSGSKTIAWEMRWRASPPRRLRRSTRAEGHRQMPADALKCKECSTTYPLEARYVCERCFGPLEVAYAPPDADPDELKRRIQAGPHTLWRYADFLPLERVAARARCRRAGRRWCGPTGSPSGSASASCGSRTRPRTRRTRSRTASSPSRSPARSELGFETRRLRLDRQPRQRGRRARRRRRAARLRVHPGRPRAGEDPRHRRLRRQHRRRPRQLRRRQPALHRARRASASWAFVNVNMRPYYAEGSKTLAFETAEQLGWELPDRVVGADRLRLAVHQDRARLRGVHRRRPARPASCRP